jgi:uncharacterized membrane protein YagU involved in acid resistance
MSERTDGLRARLFAGVVAGLIAGSVDIGAAALINGASPFLVLRSIASGLFGLQAYAAGNWVVVVGLLLQLAMSVLIAGIFSLATLRQAWLLSRAVLAGVAYGAIVFVVMNIVVVPLSSFAPRPTHITLTWLVANIAAMLVFGLLVALIVRWSLHRWMHEQRDDQRIPSSGSDAGF